LTFVFNEPLHHRPVATHFPKQVIEKDSFSKCSCEQFLRNMWFSAYLPDERLDGQSESAFRTDFGRFFWFRKLKGNDKIGTTIRALQQVVINVRAAIAAFGFVVPGWRGNGGWHAGIVSNIG
jgi:hypothetical protein